MALKPQLTRPLSTLVTRERIGPGRIAITGTVNLSLLAATSPYPGNTSQNTSNKNVSMIDIVLQATYSPAAAPTQVTGILTHTLTLWNITSQESGRAPDMIPGDNWEFLSQDNVPGANNQGTAQVDALTNSGLLVLGVYLSGSSPYDLNLLLYNSTGSTLSTPSGYIPTLLLTRYTNQTSDPTVTASGLDEGGPY
jgi:hypothetical protein